MIMRGANEKRSILFQWESEMNEQAGETCREFTAAEMSWTEFLW